MRRLLVSLTFIMIIVCHNATGQPLTHFGDREFINYNGLWFEYNAGNMYLLSSRIIMVRVDNGEDLKSIRNIAKNNHDSIIQTSLDNWFRIIFDSDYDPIQAMVEYSRQVGVNNVFSCSYGNLLTNQSGPDDPYFKQQWSLDRMRVDWAWALLDDHSQSIIAVIDAGFKIDHEDIPGVSYAFNACGNVVNVSVSVTAETLPILPLLFSMV